MRRDETTDVRKVLAAYDIACPSCEGVLAGGMFLRPILVRSDARRYVLRGHAFRRTAHRFRFQAEVVNGAADAGIRCARVLRRRDGLWGHTQGGLHWALHEFIDGRTLDWHEWLSLKRTRPDMLAALGAEVARTHDALRRLRPAGDPSLPLHLPPIRFEHLARSAALADAAIWELPRAGSCPETLAALRDRRVGDAWAMLRRAAREERTGSLPRQIVHGDISPVNLVWSSDATRPAFIDWDCVHIGLRMYDALGDVLMRAPWNAPESHVLDHDEIGVYVRGYAEATDEPLRPDERACIPLFLAARQLEDIRQRAAVAADLPPDRDPEYAALIRMRLAFIDQLRPTIEERGPVPWM